MSGILFILFLAVVFIGGGYWLGKSIGESIFGEREKSFKFYDHSTTHITHIHHHEHKSIHIIDPETKEKILELKDKAAQ